MNKQAAFLALDQGTTSSRAILFDEKLQPLITAQKEFTQYFPQPGWVEHDAEEIWQSQLAVTREVLAKLRDMPVELKALGITNQRETTVLWSRKTGRAIWRAIVWQDRRTEPWCKQQRDLGLADYVHRRTGLVLDAYFSASKLAWMLEHIAGARAAAEAGELAFGTVDSWLLWNLTGGKVHATDETNASRTLLYNIEKHDWDDALLARWHIPKALMPQVRASASHFGKSEESVLGAAVPITGIAGDQQAALFGQGCHEAGDVKNTYGTGCFMLMHTAHHQVVSRHGLITTTAASTDASLKESRQESKSITHTAGRYALEGAVFSAGAAVQWLRDGLKIIQSAAEIEPLARSVNSTGDVFMVPAFVGLGSPYWDPHARGAILGITRGTERAHLARACLESIALQSAELVLAMKEDSGSDFRSLRVDGGAAANDLLMQMQADFLDRPVIRPKVLESTARGAAALAMLGAGFVADAQQLTALLREAQQIDRVFKPIMSADAAEQRLERWRMAVKRCLEWAQPE